MKFTPALGFGAEYARLQSTPGVDTSGLRPHTAHSPSGAPDCGGATNHKSPSAINDDLTPPMRDRCPAIPSASIVCALGLISFSSRSLGTSFGHLPPDVRAQAPARDLPAVPAAMLVSMSTAGQPIPSSSLTKREIVGARHRAPLAICTLDRPAEYPHSAAVRDASPGQRNARIAHNTRTVHTVRRPAEAGSLHRHLLNSGRDFDYRPWAERWYPARSDICRVANTNSPPPICNRRIDADLSEELGEGLPRYRAEHCHPQGVFRVAAVPVAT
ncbi:hypothetical protein B0H21DRAFT_823113 [Amylocystis lapponica]|nr:hypothetical protein B0H21DRAFT_823113 [Amylocystis lapponica]